MKYIAALFVLGIIISCKNKPNTTLEKPNADTVPFYAYLFEIKKDIDSIKTKSKPVTLTNYTASNTLQTVKVKPDEVDKYCTELFTLDITQPNLKPFYKEELFNDLTTQSSVISYTTQKDSLPVKSVNILLDAKDGKTIKRVDIKKMFSRNDSLIQENYSWVFNKNYYVTTYKEAKDGKVTTTKQELKW